MKRLTIILAALVLAVTAGAGLYFGDVAAAAARSLWQQAVVPGPLSGSHAFLAGDCAACHQPVTGVERRQCVACHSDTELVQRQPTAFHASIATCSGCHVEHQQGKRMPTKMDHGLLAGASAQAAASRGANATPARLPETGDESVLQCSACHSTVDRHQGVFSSDCASCHGTTAWQVPEFVHPSFRSTTCSECHLPPPSHTMEHFSMVSRKLSGQPAARLEQCFLCHDKTSWNDIRGKGRIKHH